MPGRSTMLTLRPSGSSAMPVCCSTVTPGKFATFWRSPEAPPALPCAPPPGGAVPLPPYRHCHSHGNRYNRSRETRSPQGLMGIVFLGVPGMLDTLGMPIHADRQAARRVAAQSDFRTIHLEDPRDRKSGPEG